MLQPLEGIRVVDLTRVLAGPYCTMMLGDMGAEIIKIEQPGTGDETRGWGPPFAPNSDSAYFMAINRNKKSITLNLKHEEGKKILKELILKSDILVENFRVGTLDKLGFSYKEVEKMNPKMIYCSITAFGDTGPYAKQGGYDVIVQGMAGIMSVTGEPDGPPVKVGVPIVDVTAGMFGTSGILAALYAREKTNRGQYVVTSLLEAQLAWLVNVASNYLISGNLPKRYGNGHPNISPYEPYKAKDDYFIVAVGNEKLWSIFCKIINKEELITDEKFKINAHRLMHRKELNDILEKVFLEKTAKEWTKLFLDSGIPAGPINNLEQVFSDPQVLAREMLTEIDHPQAGKIKMVGVPIKFSDTQTKISLPPPMLGEHTDEILTRFSGYRQEQIKTLKELGVI